MFVTFDPDWTPIAVEYDMKPENESVLPKEA
jgi:hypothetical protein